MILRRWEDLPDFMRTDPVRPYYDALAKKRRALVLKRIFDVTAAAALLIPMLPLYGGMAIAIRLDSPGPVFYRQTRVTRYGKHFRIFKFRTMTVDADKQGAQVTAKGDRRITRVGKFLRKYRLDEMGQLLNVLAGDMSFVGTRPEVPKFVAAYTGAMPATLLLPAGITSEASIRYRDEARLLEQGGDPEAVYLRHILPGKMECNLDALLRYSFRRELLTMLRTVLAVLGKERSHGG